MVWAVNDTIKIMICEEGVESNPSYTPYVHGLTATKVMRYGENVIDIHGFSAQNIRSAASTLHLTNSYGTTISTTSPAEALTVTQTEWQTDYDAGNYRNGYFCIWANGLNVGKQYTFSCDIEVTDNPLEVDTSSFFFASVSQWNTVIKKQANGRYAVTFTYGSATTYKQMSIINKGCSLIISNMKLEVGSDAENTKYTPFVSSAEYTPAADGTVEGVKSLYPTTTLIPDTEGLILEADYNRDINKAFAELQQAIISTGGNV